MSSSYMTMKQLLGGFVHCVSVTNDDQSANPSLKWDAPIPGSSHVIWTQAPRLRYAPLSARPLLVFYASNFAYSDQRTE
jgi:hypothetical protein